MKNFLPLALIWLTLSLRAETALDQQFPVRGLCISAPSPAQVDRFVQFINEDLAARSVNTLILRVDYNFQYTSHPELSGEGALSRPDVSKIVAACRQHHIQVIPQINLLGHQSWANRTGALLRVYPDFDETPWVKMPERYSWPNPDKLYCKSYCPLHPKVHEVVFALIDEICQAFETDAFHAGMDEVFYLGEDKCPRCSGKDRAELFAGEVSQIRDHLAKDNRTLWIWGDRLLDGKATGLGEWEASLNGTQRAVDLIPKDVVICDWHYERADQTAAYFAFKGLRVVTCPWKNPQTAAEQVQDIVRLRSHSTRPIRDRVAGLVQTVWSGANSFLDDYYGLKTGGPHRPEEKTEAKCFVRSFDEIAALAAPTPATPAKRHLLIVGQSKGYQHEAISSAMAALFDLGHTSGLWDTCLRTDCTAITKKPLKWEAKNLDAYDAVAFFTDGELDMDESQKADLLSFVREDGKGFIGIHSATITFTSWPAYGEMLGGYFDGHPWGQFEAPLIVEDREFPGMRHLPPEFKLLDEIYQVKNFSRDRVRVLLRLDAGKLDLEKNGVHRADKDFAVMWARPYGKGRVLYNGLGHVPSFWDRPDMRKMWTDQVLWAMGAIPGDATPRPKATAAASAPKPAVTHALVLAESGGQHQAFVDAARLWLKDFAAQQRFDCDYAENTRKIDAESLAKYQVVIQLNYPPYGWTAEATNAFQEYIQKGQGGWVGFHHATLLGEFDGYAMWPWFSDFMGSIRFKNYIASFVSGQVQVEDRTHPCMRGLPASFPIAREEWYTYDRSPRPNVHVLASVDERSYAPPSAITMGDHPIVWTNEKMAARNAYIFMGHGPDLLQNTNYTALVRNAILWAASQEER